MIDINRRNIESEIKSYNNLMETELSRLHSVAEQEPPKPNIIEDSKVGLKLLLITIILSAIFFALAFIPHAFLSGIFIFLTAACITLGTLLSIFMIVSCNIASRSNYADWESKSSSGYINYKESKIREKYNRIINNLKEYGTPNKPGESPIVLCGNCSSDNLSREIWRGSYPFDQKEIVVCKECGWRKLRYLSKYY